jgi:hypothetical protein
LDKNYLLVVVLTNNTKGMESGNKEGLEIKRKVEEEIERVTKKVKSDIEKIKCAFCDEVIDFGVTCCSCKTEPMCNECTSTCGYCSGNCCHECLRRCHECGDEFCVDCVTCDNDAEDSTCDECLNKEK